MFDSEKPLNEIKKAKTQAAKNWIREKLNVLIWSRQIHLISTALWIVNSVQLKKMFSCRFKDIFCCTGEKIKSRDLIIWSFPSKGMLHIGNPKAGKSSDLLQAFHQQGMYPQVDLFQHLLLCKLL